MVGEGAGIVTYKCIVFASGEQLTGCLQSILS